MPDVQTGSVRIDRDYFIKERDNYASWGRSFWRELFQNSIDAHARVIDIQLHDLPNGNLEVTFTDNGHGFTRQVLDEVFMSMGATTKHSQDTIGGYGKARILTCWSQPNYEIRSREFHCKGRGPDYTVVETETHFHGCQFKIEVEPIDRYHNKIDMRSALKQYLSMSQMRVLISSNDPSIDGWGDWLYQRRLARDLSFGKVYVNKSKRSNQMYVRVHGALMFTRYIQPNVQIVLEINPDRSRDVLLSNRDSLHDEFQRELDDFIQTVAIDKNSVFRDRVRRENWVFSEMTLKTTRKHAKTDDLPVIIRGETPQEVITVDEAALASQEIAALSASAARLAGVSQDPVNLADTEQHSSAAADIDEVVQSMVIEVETSNAAIKKVVARYNPNNWVMGERRGRPFQAGATYKKLLKMWKIACDWAIAEYLDLVQQESLSWRPGFVFSDVEAMHKKTGGDDVLLLNPVNEEGTLAYRLRSDADRSRLLAIAAHEVAHCRHTAHDELYASMFTGIIGRLIRHKRSIFKEMNEVLSA